MNNKRETEQVVSVMRNCAEQLRKAHKSLSAVNAPVDPLTKIDGVAKALQGLSDDVEAVLLKHIWMNGGLKIKVQRLEEENSQLKKVAPIAPDGDV